VGEPGTAAGHAFISYVREDAHRADQLQRVLEAAGVPVWRDTADLWPGQDWRENIRRAITHNALVFLACFSRRSLARQVSYQNEELVLAIEQLRLRRRDDPWLIPVRSMSVTCPTVISVLAAGLGPSSAQTCSATRPPKAPLGSWRPYCGSSVAAAPPQW